MSDTIIYQAARWHAAQDSDAIDWDAFTLWIEADPRHRAALESLARIEDALMEQPAHFDALLRIAAEPPRPRRSWWGIGVGAGGAIAAALALMIALPHILAGRADPVSYRTGPDERREIALRDGSRVELAPLSQLQVTSGQQVRMAVIGSAYFDVPHRPGRDLSIQAGGLTIHDMGTRFAIDANADGARVVVADGFLDISAQNIGHPLTLTAGQNFMASTSLGLMQRGVQRADTVASWRRGDLTYEGAPLALVAADVARYAGMPVTVDPTIAKRRFSGVLTIGDGKALVGDLAAILGLKVQPVAGGIRLEPAR